MIFHHAHICGHVRTTAVPSSAIRHTFAVASAKRLRHHDLHSGASSRQRLAQHALSHDLHSRASSRQRPCSMPAIMVFIQAHLRDNICKAAAPSYLDSSVPSWLRKQLRHHLYSGAPSRRRPQSDCAIMRSFRRNFAATSAPSLVKRTFAATSVNNQRHHLHSGAPLRRRSQSDCAIMRLFKLTFAATSHTTTKPSCPSVRQIFVLRPHSDRAVVAFVQDHLHGISS